MQSNSVSSLVSRQRTRALVDARRQSFTLTEAAPVHWRIRRLAALPGVGWQRGFPYFGEESEMLEAWGLYSRSAVLRALGLHTGLTLGDELWRRVVRRLGEPCFMLADVSQGRLHLLTPHRARVR